MSSCRVCRSDDLYEFLPLGDHPPANAFLTEDQLSEPEATFPLDCHACLNCGAIIVADQLPPDFFDDYVYVPSASTTMHDHFSRFAKLVVEQWVDDPSDLVVDIGCNDGLFLASCARLGQATLGIEPAANIAEFARERGLTVVNDYFDVETARAVRSGHGAASVIVTTNTFNHIDDLHGFMAGVDVLLGDGGTFIVEVPQAFELVEKNEFDTVYHEHLTTFAVTSLARLFRFFSMRIVDVEVLPIHGGSMRVSAARCPADAAETPVAESWMKREREASLFSQPTYDALAARVHKLRDRLWEVIRDATDQGHRLAGYGAPAKGNTLLNYCQIGPDVLEYLADRNTLKHGRYSPGMHIPVVDPSRILETQPDYLLVLAWNFAEEIIEQQSEYLDRGGKFIIPIPEPRVIGS